ncbi:hypothetical protein TGCAST_218000A [Toxoplasma gondii CAST]|uniref:Uncharacterized protein n=1 Tax=Toxoplasma gondii CAST TaxID=943122 RepID=A0A425HZR4_TOXGO|nr:hypothetical protein TGCAST_218000A [Toxoplasma gondii CAST]
MADTGYSSSRLGVGSEKAAAGRPSDPFRALQSLLRSSSQPASSAGAAYYSQPLSSAPPGFSPAPVASSARSFFSSQPAALACVACGAGSEALRLDDSGNFVCGSCGVEHRGVRTLERDEQDVCLDFFGISGEEASAPSAFRCVRASAGGGGVGDAVRALAESQRALATAPESEEGEAALSTAVLPLRSSRDEQEAQTQAQLTAVAEGCVTLSADAAALADAEQSLLLQRAKRGGERGKSANHVEPLFALCLQEAKGQFGALGDGGGISGKGHSVGCEREELLLQAWQTLLLCCCRKLERLQLPAGLIECEARKVWSQYLHFVSSNRLPVSAFFCNASKRSFKIPLASRASPAASAASPFSISSSLLQQAACLRGPLGASASALVGVPLESSP